jgi:hypothetical protein
MEIKVFLESMIGQEASVNQSPTLRAKLVRIYETKYTNSSTQSTVCEWEVTPNHYGDRGNEFVGRKFNLPLLISECCFIGV